MNKQIEISQTEEQYIERPFLNLYHRLMSGYIIDQYPIMPSAGLCPTICLKVSSKKGGIRYVPKDGLEAFQLILDTAPKGFDQSVAFWDADNADTKIGQSAGFDTAWRVRLYEFGALRQTIVLLCAAIAGELD